MILRTECSQFQFEDRQHHIPVKMGERIIETDSEIVKAFNEFAIDLYMVSLVQKLYKKLDFRNKSKISKIKFKNFCKILIFLLIVFLKLRKLLKVEREI